MSQVMWVMDGDAEDVEEGADEGAVRSRDTTWLLWKANKREVARPRPALPPVTTIFLFLGGLRFWVVIVNASVAIVLE